MEKARAAICPTIFVRRRLQPKDYRHPSNYQVFGKLGKHHYASNRLEY